jgi:hypothetical protein
VYAEPTYYQSFLRICEQPEVFDLRVTLGRPLLFSLIPSRWQVAGKRNDRQGVCIVDKEE